MAQARPFDAGGRGWKTSCSRSLAVQAVAPLHPLSPQVRAILRCIRRRADETLTLRAIARDQGRQPEYLGWLFRHETGTTFHERLTTIRMRRAARLIRAGEKIDVVVHRVGYRSKKNFYDRFRRHFGMTAGEYRDRVHAGPPGQTA